MNRLILVSLVFLLEVCLGDNSQHHHHHKNHHQHDNSPIQAPKPHSRSQSISKQHKPSLVRPSRFQSLFYRLPSSHLLRGKPALRRSQPTRLNRNNTLQKSKVPKKPTHLPKIAYLKAEQIPGFQKFQLHEVIREREGTQIFKAGEKPDVIHYVSSPDTAQSNLVEKLDVRTPSDVSIPALQL
ncbi:uncharacterized protein LOC111705202 [Eurytemora carolleeae]|uniref:uncharacterized protein LOC111705202 n=1 Tax=Eurytemora carolleeae TaxID=1294199 RepID=UPI000C76869F|nr:uncharacterized protein LOC111705202 [Eurytemora carolleeae]|eukprot:XP_023333441.1 uncharacterized protein LOC111705202 [Eurytemora affinis]